RQLQGLPGAAVMPRLERVERPGVVIENLLLQGRLDVAAVLKHLDGIDLTRWVAVTVIGADDEAVLPAVARDIGNVIVVLASDVDFQFRPKVLRKLEAR